MIMSHLFFSRYKYLFSMLLMCCFGMSVSEAQIICGENTRIETTVRGLLDDNDNCVSIPSAGMVGTHVEVWIEDKDCGSSLPGSITLSAGGRTVTAPGTMATQTGGSVIDCLLYTSPSPRDATLSRMPSSA